MDLSVVVASGALAGLVGSFLNTPIDLVKCRLQCQREERARAYYKGPLDCLIKVVTEEGGIRGLYRGLLCMILREFPLCGGGFGTYFLTRKACAKYNDCQMNELGFVSKFISGAAAGVGCWLFAYPQVKYCISMTCLILMFLRM